MKFSPYKIIVVVLVGLLFYLLFHFKNSSTQNLEIDKPRIVAITQIAPHPSLDQIRKGIEDEINASNFKRLNIIYQNAQGNLATATQISQKFASISPDVIVPITTPSAQSVYAIAKSLKIPVVFSAVSDPVGAKLIAKFPQPGDGITGLSDLSPVEEQADLIKAILTANSQLNNRSTIGVIYNSGETNSVILVNLIEEALAKRGIKLLKACASTTIEVAAAAKSLIGKVSAIYLPNDNTIISALESVLLVTNEHKVPVISADPESVARGCLATISHNQYQLGRQTGAMVVRMLKGESLHNIPVEKPAKIELLINLDTAKHMGILIPDNLIKKADRLIEKVAQDDE
jgi:putative ABC transport system substrate-binding protein